ncbi:hypothetical protein GCM10027614_16210 [Micromonospora vulcania]
MNYDTFIDQVAQRTRTPSEQAVELTRAVLETFAERLTGGEVLDLAAQLPRPLQLVLKPHPGIEQADRFGAAEFVARVALRADVQEPAARTPYGPSSPPCARRSAEASSTTWPPSYRATSGAWWSSRWPRERRCAAADRGISAGRTQWLVRATIDDPLGVANGPGLTLRVRGEYFPRTIPVSTARPACLGWLPIFDG